MPYENNNINTTESFNKNHDNIGGMVNNVNLSTKNVVDSNTVNAENLADGKAFNTENLADSNTFNTENLVYGKIFNDDKAVDMETAPNNSMELIMNDNIDEVGVYPHDFSNDDDDEMEEVADERIVPDIPVQVEALLRENKITAATFEKFINAIGKGNNRLSQNVIKETFVFDDNWIYQIEGALFSIEKIAKSPKSIIIDERSVVPIEKAKKINSETVRHLASHTSNIKGFDDDGMVMPTKLLTTEMVEFKQMYENRFVYSLIKLLSRFVDDRYFSAKKKIDTYTTNTLGEQSTFKLGRTEVKFLMSMEIKTKNRKSTEIENTEAMLLKIEMIKKRLEILSGTEFCREMSKAKLVTPPIIKTNILLMNVDYKNCYKLYLFISAYHAMGYSVDVSDKNLTFDVDYFDDLTLLTALSLKAMTDNNMIRHKLFAKIPSSQRVKNYKVVDKFDFQASFGRDGDKRDDELNQYYFDKIKNIMSRATKVTRSTIVSEKTLTGTFGSFYKGLAKINRSLYDEVMKVKPDTKEKKKPLTRKLDSLKMQKEQFRRAQILTRLMTADLNLQIKKEAKDRVKMEKLNFEYEKMLLSVKKSDKTVIKKKKFTDEDVYVDKKIDVYVGKKKIVNATLLQAEYEKEKIRLEKQELQKAKRREAYKLRKLKAEKIEDQD